MDNSALGRIANMHLALCDMLELGARDPLAMKLAEAQVSPKHRCIYNALNVSLSVYTALYEPLFLRLTRLLLFVVMCV
jgi:hypothetical protein